MRKVISLKERAENYNISFPKFAKQAPLFATERWLYGIWMIGNNYQNKQGYYGEYPPSYLKRIYSLFPDVKDNEILHLFSGSLTKEERGTRLDLSCEFEPDIICSIEEFFEAKRNKKPEYKLIIADPPYSEEDAMHYGNPMINRNKVVKNCLILLKKEGFLVWLDQVYPMYSKDEMQLVGTIGVIRSTNHRVRCVFIYQKKGDDLKLAK